MHSFAICHTLALQWMNSGKQAKLAFPITGFLTTCPSIEGKGCFETHHLEFFNNWYARECNLCYKVHRTSSHKVPKFITFKGHSPERAVLRWWLVPDMRKGWLACTLVAWVEVSRFLVLRLMVLLLFGWRGHSFKRIVWRWPPVWWPSGFVVVSWKSWWRQLGGKWWTGNRSMGLDPAGGQWELH